MTYRVPEPRSSALQPKLEGRRLSLVPITPADYPYLHHLSTTGENLMAWRLRGATPSPEIFAQQLWQSVLVQFKIVHGTPAQPLGLLAAYNADMRNQLVFVAILLEPDAKKSGWVMEAPVLFIDYLFNTWPFRKIYMEAFEFNFAAINSGPGRIFQVEGCLLDYEYHDNKYWHKYIVSMGRDQWAEVARDIRPSG